MAFFCEDSVSGYNYTLKIVDIGDQDAEIIVTDRENLHKLFDAGFFENEEGSHFTLNGQKSGNFDIQIPGNNLDKAYYTDGANSQALDCTIYE